MHKSLFFRFILPVTLLIFMQGSFLFARGARGPDTAELLIGAAASLTDVMQELAVIYQAQNPNIRLEFTFASSGALQNQIMEGAPIDIFFSAAAAQMNNLEARGLIHGGGRNLLRNSIALIVPINSRAEISGFMDAASDAVQIIALGDPQSVPGGTRAKEAFTYLGIADKIYGAGRAVFAFDIRTVLTWVEMGEADAGVVFLTDAITSDRVRVAEIADSTWHAPSVNPIGIVKGSPNTAAAQRFIDFLFSDTAGAVFVRHGFSMY